MSGFDFPSAPGRGGIQSTMIDLAVMKWSRDQLFGTDHTTQAIRAQTALHEKQYRYERGMNTLQSFSAKFQAKLDYVDQLLDKSEVGLSEFYSCEFLRPKFDLASSKCSEFVGTLQALLTQGNFKKADKFHDQYLEEVVESLAHLVACAEFYTETAKQLQEQDLIVFRTFASDENYQWSVQLVSDAVSSMIQDMTDLSESGTWDTFLVFDDEELNVLGSGINEVIDLHETANQLFDEGRNLCSKYVDLQQNNWNTLVSGDSVQVAALSATHVEMVNIFEKEIDCEEKWLDLQKQINQKVERIQERLKNKLLAKDMSNNPSSKSEQASTNIDSLVKLAELLEKGFITKDDFEAQKIKLLG